MRVATFHMARRQDEFEKSDLGPAPPSGDLDRGADGEAQHGVGAAAVDRDLGQAVGVLVPQSGPRRHEIKAVRSTASLRLLALLVSRSSTCSSYAGHVQMFGWGNQGV